MGVLRNIRITLCRHRTPIHRDYFEDTEYKYVDGELVERRDTFHNRTWCPDCHAYLKDEVTHYVAYYLKRGSDAQHES